MLENVTSRIRHFTANLPLPATDWFSFTPHSWLQARERGWRSNALGQLFHSAQRLLVFIANSPSQCWKQMSPLLISGVSILPAKPASFPCYFCLHFADLPVRTTQTACPWLSEETPANTGKHLRGGSAAVFCRFVGWSLCGAHQRTGKGQHVCGWREICHHS